MNEARSFACRGIVLTGATGYIGGALRRALQAAATPVVLVPGPNTYIEPAKTERVIPEAALDHADFSGWCLLHMATLYRVGDWPTLVEDLVDANLRFGLSVARRFRAAGGARVVAAGTWQQQLATRDGAFPSAYAASKAAFDVFSRSPEFRDGISWAQLLLYDVVGPGDPRPKAVPSFAKAVREGLPIHLPDEEVAIDAVDIEDVVRAFLRAAQADWSGDFTVARREPTTLSAIAELVMTALDRRVDVINDYPVRHRATMAPVYDAPALPEWRPEISLENAIARVVA